MAQFDTSGFDEVITEMIRMGEDVGPVADEMLMAGAAEVKEAWRNTAERHQYHDTGDMINSIGYPKKPKEMNDIRVIDIYPQGKDRKGVRNAEKAYLLHYGTKSIPGSGWVDEANDEAGPQVAAVMTEIWEEHLLNKGG